MVDPALNMTCMVGKTSGSRAPDASQACTEPVPSSGLRTNTARGPRGTLLATDATVVMSVPNDAFWATENPHHRTMWGEGAFAELQSLLPEGHTVAPQVQ